MGASVGINQCHVLGQWQKQSCFLGITPVDVVFRSVIVLNWQTKADIGRTELCDGFRFLCGEWEGFFALCKLRNITAYFFFFFFFPSVAVLRAVCQGLVLMLCSPANSETFNRYFSLRWSGYARVCQTATFYVEQHHTTAPAWGCHIADGCDSSNEPLMR